MHKLSEQRLVAVHKLGENAEGRQEQIPLHFFDLGKARDLLADHVISHQRHAVIVAARAVVEIFPAAKVGAPVRDKVHILPLHPFPDGFPLRFGIVQGHFLLNFPPARFGVQHMAAAVKL